MAKLLNRRPEYHSEAEKVVVEHLLDQLSADWAIAHSVDWCMTDRISGGQSNGECDVVAIGPTGVVAIEVKGGAITRDGADRFVSTDRFGNMHDVTNPARQASGAMYRIRDALRRRNVPDRHYAHAVVFPDCTVTPGAGSAPLGLDLEGGVLIDGKDLDGIGERIAELVPCDSAVAFTTHQLEKIYEVFEPSWSLGGALALDVARTGDRAAELTDQQHDFIRGLHANHRVVVEGGAGSGKSVIALRTACEAATAGGRSLYVCFNIPLAAQQAAIAAGIEGSERASKSGGELRITTFHQLIEDWLDMEKIGRGARPGPGDQAGRSAYYDRIVDLAERHAAVGETFDSIVIDEGQDFDQRWIDLLETALDKPDESSFYMFMDPLQNIYRPEVNQQIEGALSYELTKNCRTGATLAKSIAEFLGDPVPDCPIEGGSPMEVADCESADEADEALRTLLHRLTHEDGMKPRDIVIQSIAGPARSRYWGRRFGNLTLVGRNPDTDETPGLGPNDVRIETVHRFKGLEAPATIVLATEPARGASLANLLRVGLTRATNFAALIRIREGS